MSAQLSYSLHSTKCLLGCFKTELKIPFYEKGKGDSLNENLTVAFDTDISLFLI